MVLIFSKVQRCNQPGAPNGHYGYKEQWDASEEVAQTLIAAGIAGKVEQPAQKEKPKAEPESTEIPIEPEHIPDEPAEEITEPEKPDKVYQRAQAKKKNGR